MVSVGIDVGSAAAKAVVFDGAIRGFAVIPTGWNPKEAGRRVFELALHNAGLTEQNVDRITGTGYGRISLAFIDQKVTELTCHARGANFLFPETRTVIDIGGQDSKVISVAANGSATDFVMNDKCAAGTGRFLQVMTGVLDLTLAELGELAISAEPAKINSMCTVFAESEIIGLLAQGVPKPEIAAGIIASIADKLASLTARIGCKSQVTFCGGAANSPEICSILSSSLGVRFNVPVEPQIVGALGAAIIGSAK